jgi:hypothetical protein
LAGIHQHSLRHSQSNGIGDGLVKVGWIGGEAFPFGIGHAVGLAVAKEGDIGTENQPRADDNRVLGRPLGNPSDQCLEDARQRNEQ